MKRFIKILKRTMIVIISLALILTVVVFFYMRQDKFGKAPSGARLERIKQSPNYKDGAFQNRTYTPTLTKGYTMAGLLYNQLFKSYPRRRPVDSLPSIKTDLLTFPADSNLLVWFGHSSYYMQINGLKILVDPVFSGNASPIPGTAKSFNGADIYTVDDIPTIDYLLISHDHYDHLDYETILKLRQKVQKVVCGLGVGEHFEYWGYPASMLIEKDWDETVELENNINIHTLTARHFSGRTFKRNNTLWLAYLVETPTQKLFLGGDSGFSDHFEAIGNKFGPIDLAILENGQYNVAWHAIHTLPEETLKAAKALKAKRLMPVHSSKFTLGQHPWDEPLSELVRYNETYKLPLVTPLIGEMVNLNDTIKVYNPWWPGRK